MKLRLLGLLLVSAGAFGVALGEMPFDERVRQASVVMIGTVEDVMPRFDRGPVEYARVRMETVLKGSPPEILWLRTSDGFIEDNVICQVGRRYLFLLTRSGDYFVSVNGQYGAIPADGQPVYAALKPEPARQ